MVEPRRRPLCSVTVNAQRELAFSGSSRQSFPPPGFQRTEARQHVAGESPREGPKMSGRPKRSLYEVKIKPGLYWRLQGSPSYGISAEESFTQRVQRA